MTAFLLMIVFLGGGGNTDYGLMHEFKSMQECQAARDFYVAKSVVKAACMEVKK